MIQARKKLCIAFANAFPGKIYSSPKIVVTVPKMHTDVNKMFTRFAVKTVSQ